MSEFEFKKLAAACQDINLEVVSVSPAIAMGTMYLSAAQSNGLMFENAVYAQFNQFITSQAVTAQSVQQVFSQNNVANASSIADLMQDR